MTQTPFDAFSKEFLADLLAPFGTVERSFEVPGESKYIDLLFYPSETVKVIALPLDDPRRATLLRMLCAWKIVTIETNPSIFEIPSSVRQLAFALPTEKIRVQAKNQILKS